ncbi:MAG: transposase [Pseudonocardiaceae bacterium]
MTTTTNTLAVETPSKDRRSWPAEYKLGILAEIDQAGASGDRGQVGEICRREGLYSSLISTWRDQRDAGALEGLRDRKPGPKADPTRAELARLRGDNARLTERLATAEELIDAQGKAFALLREFAPQSAKPNGTSS